MNAPHEPDLKAAMQRLSDVAGPADLADAALRGAKGMRRRRGVLAALAAVATVAGLSVPFLVTGGPQADSPGFTLPVGAAASAPGLGGCQDAPMVNPTTKEVAEQHWPEYVQTVLGLLPDRDDYVVQNTYDICNWGEPGASNAYTVINLGHLREHGHLTVNLYVYDTDQWVPDSCADLDALAAAGHQDVLFCQAGGNAEPLLYATAYDTTSVTVGAVYADHRAVVMERIGAEAVPVISVDALKAVVADRALLDLIPTADGPLPTPSAHRPVPEASTAAKR
ncbi:hypothetical protein [Catellatospora citrea]|uniref:Uncharacterized protein n=1 Tax=Catellatospora citrea TaxID=53366 RepID=A0A8J3KKI7_9ACTN|nr:hypothetical protein [Catellatospora citrea]RKE12198.1 hypothetical protein C8E86_7135 [Catellatospora citrea]GIF98838.1 hypothetical protein Cci01nite_39320 [Catellatospora citrea]